MIYRNLLIIFLLFVSASWASAESIHATWETYTPAEGKSVTGYVLYQEGEAVCLTMNPNAISIDCEVTLTEDVTNFTLRATLSDATQSPHSVQSTYNQTEGGSLNFVWGRSIHVEWGYTPPNEPEVTGFQLYQEGNASCFWEGADTNAGDCTVVLTAEITNFTLTATFSDGTESPHSAPFAFNPDDAASGDDGDTTNPFIRMIITKHWHQFRKTGSKPVRYGTGKLGARFR